MSYGPGIYDTLALEYREAGSQLLADCPACGKKRKFYIDRKKTTYHCKVCGVRGNAQTFLEVYFEKMCEDLPKAEVALLSQDRRLPISALRREMAFRWDSATEQIVCLIRNEEGVPITVRRSTKRRVDRKTKKGKRRFLNLKGTPVGLLGMEDLKLRPGDPVYLVEGEWDWLAMRMLLRKMRSPGVVIAVPGVDTFKEEWAAKFRNRKVYVYFDNDEPGKKGSARTAKILRPYVDTVRIFCWDVAYPDGYDINDFVSDNFKSLNDVYDELHDEESLSAYAPREENAEGMTEEAQEQERLEPMSVEELHDTFHRWLRLDNCDMIDVLMGTLWSIHLPGNPLWLFVVAPSSGSKSETLMPISAWHRCYDLSTLKPKSLISGFISKGDDPSLFAQLDGKRATVIVKDLTPLLENENDMEAVFSILRDAYDGSYKQTFGNGAVREYTELHFGMIAGVTYAIDEYNSVAMGERFLKFRADKEIGREQDIDIAIQAVMNSAACTDMQKELREACVRCLARKLDPTEAPVPDREFAQHVARIAKFCGIARAVAPSDKFTEVQSMTPSEEVPARIAIQLTKLARGLATHYEAENLNDPRILRLIRRVAIHTPDIITVRIIRALYLNFETSGCTVKNVVDSHRNLSFRTVQEALKRLVLTGVVEPTEMADGKKAYQLAEFVYEIIRGEDLFDSLPSNDPLFRGRRLILGRKK